VFSRHIKQDIERELEFDAKKYGIKRGQKDHPKRNGKGAEPN
jgi:hypothetical protein